MSQGSLSKVTIPEISQSYHFTTALIELFDRLIKLLYRERHGEGVSGSTRLTIEVFPKSTMLLPEPFLCISVRRQGTRQCISKSAARSWLVGVGVVVFRSCIGEVEARKWGPLQIMQLSSRHQWRSGAQMPEEMW